MTNRWIRRKRPRLFSDEFTS